MLFQIKLLQIHRACNLEKNNENLKHIGINFLPRMPHIQNLWVNTLMMTGGAWIQGSKTPLYTYVDQT